MIRFVCSASFCMQPKAAKTLVWRHPDAVNASKWLLLASWAYKQPFYLVPQLWAAPSLRQLVLSRILLVCQDGPWMMRSNTVQHWAVWRYSPITGLALQIHKSGKSCDGIAGKWGAVDCQRGKEGHRRDAGREHIKNSSWDTLAIKCSESLDALLPHNADSQRLIWLWDKYSHRGRED